MHDALLGTQPAQLRIARQPPPETAEVLGDLVERQADDVMPESLYRRGADVVASSDGERESVTLEVRVCLQDDVHRRVVRIGVHRIRAVLGARSGEA